MTRPNQMFKEHGQWKQNRPGPQNYVDFLNALQLKVAPFIIVSDEPTESGGKKLTCRNPWLDVGVTLTTDKNGRIPQEQCRSVWITAKSKVKSALATKEVLQNSWNMNEKVVTVRPTYCQYIFDEYPFDQKDPGVNRKINDRATALRKTVRDLPELARTYRENFGLNTHITPTNMSFNHPLLTGDMNCNAEHPLRMEEVEGYFKKVTLPIIQRSARYMDNLATLGEYGFMVGEQNVDGQLCAVISRPCDERFNPVLLPLRALGPSAPLLPEMAGMHGLLLQNPARRVATLKSRYPLPGTEPLVQTPDSVPAPAARMPAPAPEDEEAPGQSHAARHTPRIRPRSEPGYRMTESGIKIFVRGEDDVRHVVPNAPAPVADPLLLDAICEQLAALPRVTVIFDTSALEVFQAKRGLSRGTANGRYYYDALGIAEDNPAVHYMGYPSVVADFETMHKVTVPQEMGDKHFRSVIDSSRPGPERLERQKAAAGFFGEAHRWQVRANGAEHFVSGKAGGKRVIWETAGQNELYKTLLEEAERASGVKSGPAFDTAFRDARKRLGTNMGETVCVDTALHYNGSEPIIIVSDDKGCADMVRRLNEEGKCTKAGRGIGWMSSSDFLDALDISCNGALAQELERMGGTTNGKPARYNDILDDFDEYLRQNPGSYDTYRQKQRNLSAAIVGRRKDGTEEATLEQSLCAGSELAQNLQDLHDHSASVAFFNRAKGVTQSKIVIPLAQELLNHKTDPRQSRLVY